MKKALLPLVIIVTLASCFQRSPKEKVVSPPGYDLSSPVKLVLDEDLDEISGIRFIPADSTIIAINDEEGKLYRLNMKGKKIGKAFKFAKKSDFEDIAFDGTAWYAIKSNGEVTRINNAFTDSVTTSAYPFPEQGWEFETIVHDPKQNKLALISKTPPQLSNGKVPAFVLDTATGKFTEDLYYGPDTAMVRSLLNKKKMQEVKPTSAAFHPITGELYILSVNDRLLIIMKDGSTTGAYKLEKERFRQPEGICFMPDGTMLISNEAQESTPNILVFGYRK